MRTRISRDGQEIALIKLYLGPCVCGGDSANMLHCSFNFDFFFFFSSVAPPAPGGTVRSRTSISRVKQIREEISVSDSYFLFAESPRLHLALRPA